MEPREQSQRTGDAGPFDLESILDEHARVEIMSAANAVLAELGPEAPRGIVVSRIATSWQAGKRLPLCLVKVGLDAARL